MWHVAWAGAAATGQALEVPAALARRQGLAEGSMVSVRALPDTPAAQGVCVEPDSIDDWEQLELNAGYVEEQLLNQARHSMGARCFKFPRGPARSTRLAIAQHVTWGSCPNVGSLRRPATPGVQAGPIRGHSASTRPCCSSCMLPPPHLSAKTAPMAKALDNGGAQVGVVQAGQAFPVWVRGALLFLRVTSTAPAPVVRLVLGAELAVAPRPRLRKDSGGVQQSGGAGARAERQALRVAAAAAGPPVWLRVLVGAIHRPGMFEQ